MYNHPENTMRLVRCIFVLVVLSHASYSQPIPREVKSTVTFIYVDNGEGKRVPNGTAFFTGVRDTSKEDLYAVYLVTAKHVLQRPDKKTYYSEVFFRLNKRDGDAGFIRIDLHPDGSAKNVFVHDDPTVDIAVVPEVPDNKVYDFKILTDDYLTSKADFTDLGITEGTDIFFTGLFTPHIGEHKNYPIVRFGKVALVTDEKIEWEGTKTELYLVESSSYGGNSGAPVFFYLGADREPGALIIGSPVLKLAGIMKGFFGESRPITMVETAKVPASTSNIGIAAVVPAFYLQDILSGKELTARRGF